MPAGPFFANSLRITQQVSPRSHFLKYRYICNSISYDFLRLRSHIIVDRTCVEGSSGVSRNRSPLRGGHGNWQSFAGGGVGNVVPQPCRQPRARVLRGPTASAAARRQRGDRSRHRAWRAPTAAGLVGRVSGLPAALAAGGPSSASPPEVFLHRTPPLRLCFDLCLPPLLAQPLYWCRAPPAHA